MRPILFLLTFPLLLISVANFAHDLPSENKESWQKIVHGHLVVSDSQKVTLLNAIANEYTNQNPDSAVVYAKLVLSLISGDTLKEEQLRTYKTLAKTYYVLGDSKNSYESSLKVIEIARFLNDEVSILFGQVHLGLAFLLQNRLREAIEVFNHYLAMAQELKDSSSVSRAYLDLSIGYDGLHLYDSALMYVDSCIYTSVAIKDNYYLAMGYNRKGYILSGLEQYDSAVANHRKSLAIMDGNNNWERGFAYAGLAKAYSGNQDFANSISYGQKSLELARQMNAKWEIGNAAEIISDAFASAGDFESAYEYHKLFKAYHDSIFTEENERRINEIQLRQAQTERDALKQENQLQVQILSQKNVQLILMVIIAVILVVLLVVLYLTAKNRRKYTEELAQQRDKLDEINKSKNRILSILAHDMRSPINSILGLLNIRKQKTDLDFDFDELLDELYKRTATISNTLNNLLDWSVSQFQNTKAIIEAVKVETIMEEQINLCSHDASDKGIIIIHDKTHAQEAMVQLEHLRIILRNLISNAIKYSFEKGHIFLEYQEQPDTIAIQVKDEGIGISEAMMAGLFASKANSSRGTKDEFGTGIGLFICREYAEMNAGTLTVSSQEGKGTIFILTLPKAQAV